MRGADRVRIAVFLRILFMIEVADTASNFVPTAYSISYVFLQLVFPSIFTLFLNSGFVGRNGI